MFPLVSVQLVIFIKTYKMKFLFSLLATVLAVTSAQKRQFNFSKSSVGFGGPRSPPSPPGFGGGPFSSGGSGSDPKPPSLPPNFNEVSLISGNAPAAADAESSSGSAFRPSSYQKWVYCNNGWRQVGFYC